EGKLDVVGLAAVAEQQPQLAERAGLGPAFHRRQRDHDCPPLRLVRARSRAISGNFGAAWVSASSAGTDAGAPGGSPCSRRSGSSNSATASPSSSVVKRCE